MALPLDDVSSLMARFLGAIVDLEGLLRKIFRIFRGEILSVKIQISMKAPFCGGDFLLRVIRRSIHTTNESVFKV